MKTTCCLLFGGCLVLTAGAAWGDDTSKPKPNQGQERKVDPDKLFDRLDKNKDGYIDKDEAPPRLKERFDQIDTDKDGKISKEEFKQAMALMQQFRGGAGGKPKPGQGGAPNPDTLFDRLDKNKDGFIDKSEAPEKLKEHFDQIDTNKDGKISKDEFRQAMQLLMRNRKGENSPSKPSANTPGVGDSKPSKPSENKPAETADAKKPAGPSFDSLDKNADGRLTREELKGTPLEDKFDEIDTNKDGKIDPKEYEAYLKKKAK
jgi:Ca2+-binding EF-hand superfamily protein